MALRSLRERIYQTLSYEFFGLLVITPLMALIAGFSGVESLTLLVAVSIACMAWSPIHNTLFDWFDWRYKHSVASERSQCGRVVHALSLETTSILVSNPVIMLVTGVGFWEALLLDVALTIGYTIYAYFFHLTYDWLRPVRLKQHSLPRNSRIDPMAKVW